MISSGDTSLQVPMGLSEYLRTRLSSLRPPLNTVQNPITILRQLNRRHWQFLMIAWLGWTWDAVDFFSVSLTTTEIAKSFGVSLAEVTWGITLVLMFRSVGSIVFGVLADRYGRRYPFCADLLLFIVLELGTGFSRTFQQFLAVRALYGIAMGGLYGICAATALEDCPKDARGIVGGFLQQGYTFGYLLVTVFARALVPTTPHGWRSLFWFSAGPPVLLIIAMLLLPETDTFLASQRLRQSLGGNSSTFVQEYRTALRRHWLVLLYTVVMMCGFNFITHGSQDLYPSMLSSQYNKTPDEVTVIQVVANVGALFGGTIVGHCSQIFGRRLSIIVSCVIGGALLYPYTATSSQAVIAAAFFEQFFVQGVWGIVPIHLTELAPPALRTLVVGTSFQLGNLCASASSTIEATIGERFPLPPLHLADGVTERYVYGKVIAILVGAAYAYIVVIVFIGPEWLGRPLDVEHDEDVRDVAQAKGGDVEQIEHIKPVSTQSSGEVLDPPKSLDEKNPLKVRPVSVSDSTKPSDRSGSIV